jgi:hypothetical protein
MVYGMVLLEFCLVKVYYGFYEGENGMAYYKSSWPVAVLMGFREWYGLYY